LIEFEVGGTGSTWRPQNLIRLGGSNDWLPSHVLGPQQRAGR
jgi:hypothetical protein